MANSGDGSCVKLAFSQSTTNSTILGISFMRRYSVIYNQELYIGFAYANTSVCGGEWQTGIELSQEELLMNIIILGSIFGFMIVSLLFYFGIGALCSKKQQIGYERLNG